MNPELLLDIAKLIRKYPPDVWEELLQHLHKPDFREKVLYVAREMSRLSHQSRINVAQVSARSDDEEILFRRAVLLDQIRTDLRRRRVSEVRGYAESLRIPFDSSMGKEALIKRILKALAAKDVQEIERTRTPTLFGRPVTEDYERWGELIMGKKGRNKR